LRDSVRAQSSEWTPSRWGIGYYRAELSLKRGYGEYVDTQMLSFWYLPKKEIAIMLGSIAAFFVAVAILRRKVSVRVGLKK
jgi:hypothetical protein